MKIKELLDRPEKWTKGCLAKNSEGLNTSSYSESAVCWCLFGAFYKCYLHEEQILPTSHAEKVLTKIKKYLYSNSIYGDIAHWNDAPERTFEDVRKLVEELDI